MRFRQLPVIGQKLIAAKTVQTLQPQIVQQHPSTVQELPQAVHHGINVPSSPMDLVRSQVITNPQILQHMTDQAKMENHVNCPCAINLKCIDCNSIQQGNDVESQILNELDPASAMEQGQCWCAQRTMCPNCFLAKEVKKIHETSYKEAEFDADTQQKLAAQAQLEAKLFTESQKFAKQAQDHEQKAQEAAKVLQKETSEANEARKQMEHYQQQAKMVAFKSIKTMNQFPLHMTSPGSEIKIQQVGLKQTSVVQTQPEFAIEMHANDVFTDDQFLEQHKF